MKTCPELLAPLNDWKSLATQTNVLENADSFYFGLRGNFSNRQLANNFSIEDFPKVIQKIHNAGKKCYLATNIIVYDNELIELHQTLEFAKKFAVDAVICHDIASIMIARQLGIPFHVSTQLNVSNVISAKFFQELGAERIILARELDLEQISSIKKALQTKIECFVHGAMCTAISGRCYFSAEIEKNVELSANRGKCTQPCRRIYTLVGDNGEPFQFETNSGMFFNAKDLCMIDHIPDLINSGIDAFKIEGRMRDPIYIGETTACYREALTSFADGTYSPQKIEGWIQRLKKVFNRGFHTGFYYKPPTPSDIQFQAGGNQADFKRQFIGKVTHYFGKIGVVEIELHAGSLKIGDKIIFENAIDFYFIQIINTIQHNEKSIDSTGIASKDNHIIITIKVDRIIPLNANVFLLKERNAEPSSNTEK